jgi:hypothetical protein
LLLRLLAVPWSSVLASASVPLPSETMVPSLRRQAEVVGLAQMARYSRAAPCQLDRTTRVRWRGQSGINASSQIQINRRAGSTRTSHQGRASILQAAPAEVYRTSAAERQGSAARQSDVRARRFQARLGTKHAPHPTRRVRLLVVQLRDLWRRVQYSAQIGDSACALRM